MWTCPVCQAILNLSGSQWQCENNHCYDRARAGYVNLLLANQKNRPDPGDNKVMLSARRAFLESDHYLLLVHALADTIAQHLQQTSLTIHDAGCGEGYYLSRIAARLEAAGRSVSATGNDISRAAIEMAARKYRQLQFAIAGNFKLPLQSGSREVLLQVFAPSLEAEVQRVLGTGGLWVRVTPAPEHLIQLRTALYETPQPHEAGEAIPAGFELRQQSRLQFDFHLPDLNSRQALLMMTPYYWRVEAAAMDVVLEKMTMLSADFSVTVLRKVALV